jgi:hypothetical protein
MSILKKFVKQPADRQDYDISFVPWLAKLGDAGASATVVVETGLTLSSFTLVDGVVKVWVLGGADGISYKVTVTLTTVGSRVKQVEIVIKVKET